MVAEVGRTGPPCVPSLTRTPRWAASSPETGGVAILRGDFAPHGRAGSSRLIAGEQELIAGDLVTTSGRGRVYPAGLVAGHVEEVRTDASA